MTKLERPILGCWRPLTMPLGELSTTWRGRPSKSHFYPKVDNDLLMTGWRTRRKGKREVSLTTQSSSSPPPTELWHQRFSIGRRQIWLKIRLIAEPWSRRWLKRAPERQHGRPAGGGNQGSCLCLKSGQGFQKIKNMTNFPVSSKLYLEQASGTMKSLFHITDWLPTIVQGVAGGQVWQFLSIFL